MKVNFEDIFRELQAMKDTIDNNDKFLANLSNPERAFANRVTGIAEWLAEKMLNI